MRIAEFEERVRTFLSFLFYLSILLFKETNSRRICSRDVRSKFNSTMRQPPPPPPLPPIPIVSRDGFRVEYLIKYILPMQRM